MGKLKSFYLNNKSDIDSLAILAGFFISIFILTWGCFGNLYIDNGREAYLPQLVLDGKILFKEIFAMYNPLSYQINAIVYAIFGASFNTLYLLGGAISFLIVVGIYGIARFFSKPVYSLVFCIFICGMYIFSSFSCVNYIFPYAYAMLYALLCFIYFVFFALKYLNTEKPIYTYLASLLLGISLANKFEFSFCVIPFLILLIYKRIGIKNFNINILCFLIPSAISWGILFLQGFTPENLKTYMEFGRNFFDSYEQKTYISKVMPVLSFERLKLVLLSFLSAVIYIFLNIKIIKFMSEMKVNLKFLLFLIYLAMSYFLVKLIFIAHFNPLSWVVVGSLVLGLFLIKDLPIKKSLMLFMLACCSVISSVRLNFVLGYGGYSIYFILVPALSIYIYFMEFTRIKDNENIKKALSVFLIVFSLLNLFLVTFSKKTKYLKISTEKGAIYGSKKDAASFKEALYWLKYNTNKDDKIVSLPEGSMFNFILDNPTDNMYYHLIPNHISALSEAKIVNAFTKNPPEYFLLNNVSYDAYGHKYICEDFGFDICGFIHSNYALKAKFVDKNGPLDSVYIEIYKKKN